MRIIFYIVRKEFRQIFRNKGMLPIIFVMPIIQLLILSNAATFEVKNIHLDIVDGDHSRYSRLLVSKFEASEYFLLERFSPSYEQATEAMQAGKTNLILEIPPNFERDLLKDQGGQVGMFINAIDGASAGVASGYANAILRDFNAEIRTELMMVNPEQIPARFSVSQLFWFNPELNYQTFMVPGILVMLVTMISLFLAGMNIVREKEIGTLEQINVTPIKKGQFIIGKLLPFWMLGLFELAFGLLVGKLIFDIPMVGSLGIVFAFAAIYLVLVLGVGLFISTFTETQQQAMFLAWFFMVIFILMSGLFTPIESMPDWAQRITDFNPVRFFVEVMRMVLLKGAGWAEIWPQFLRTAIYAVIVVSLAVWNYRKAS